MKLTAEQLEGAEYFEKRYEIIANYPLAAEKKIYLSDSPDKNSNLCRFCGRGKPDVKFKKVAHAVSEFLGNKVLISRNECDACNQYLADHGEDDFSKWLGPLRSASGMKGKHGRPIYKADGIRIEHGPQG